MDPPIKAIAAADTNVFRAGDVARQANIPFWDLIFDYVIDAPEGNLIKLGDDLRVVKNEPMQRTEAGALGLLNYETVSKAAQGAAEGVFGAATVPAAGIACPPAWPLMPALPLLMPLLMVTGAVGGAEGGSIAFTRPGIRIVHRRPDASPGGFAFSSFVQQIYGSPGLTKAALLPRKRADVVKLARQGEFDNIHIAPRMKANLLIGRSNLSTPEYASTLGEIRMAPFCEHDCFHTHWRWGANWDDPRMKYLLMNKKQISGFGSDAPKFSGAGIPNSEIGAPLVPLNQDVTVSFESGHVFNYTAKVTRNVVPGVWQAIFHHGSGYAVSIVDKTKVLALVHGLTGGLVDGVTTPQFSEFYWTLRYQDTVDGPLARVEADDATLARLMGL
jgi:hypothetical protein